LPIGDGKVKFGRFWLARIEDVERFGVLLYNGGTAARLILEALAKETLKNLGTKD
jgi:hypothetical protein